MIIIVRTTDQFKYDFCFLALQNFTLHSPITSGVKFHFKHFILLKGI